MAELTLIANERKTIRKSDNKKLRREGRIPGVLYGRGIEPVSFDVAENSLRPVVFTSEAHLVNLKIGDKEPVTCVLKDIQFDPITDKVVHFDLLSVLQDQEIEVEVPVLLIGNSIGVKNGGVIDQIIHKLSIKCLAKELPEHLEVNIEDLNVGNSIHVSDVSFKNVEILNSPEAVIVAIVGKKAEVEPVEGETEPTQPEVIAKGKAASEEE